MLHSMILMEEQVGIFETPSSKVAKILLSTNISSVTLPNLRVVVEIAKDEIRFQKTSDGNAEALMFSSILYTENWTCGKCVQGCRINQNEISFGGIGFQLLVWVSLINFDR